MKYVAAVGERTFEIEINQDGEILVDGARADIDFRSVGGGAVYSMILNGKSYEALVQPGESGMEVLLQGRLYPVKVEDERQRRLRESSGIRVAQRGDFHLTSPMPGLIVAVPVEEGQEVEEGADLVILESMKMQNELKAPRPGKVTRVRVKAGDSVDQNEVLVTLS